jgi:hypothetical protein
MMGKNGGLQAIFPTHIAGIKIFTQGTIFNKKTDGYYESKVVVVLLRKVYLFGGGGHNLRL